MAKVASASTRKEYIEPSTEEVDRLIGDLEASWKSTVTVRRQAPNDVGYREIFISLDGEKPERLLQYGETMTLDVSPGPHRLKAHNTLFLKSIDFTVGVGEHARFTAIAFLFGFLGAGPFYLTFERD
jgi:hypothetical protein